MSALHFAAEPGRNKARKRKRLANPASRYTEEELLIELDK